VKPDLDLYLERIGYFGSRDPVFETFRAVHRCQGIAIPYENLDVYLERPVEHDIESIFEKIVIKGRGGWCYELNGLLGWALTELGFPVTRYCGGLEETIPRESYLGNHLLLGVDLDDETWIADLGLGGSLLDPIPLREDTFRQEHGTFRLEKTTATTWRYYNRKGVHPPVFDFLAEAADEDILSDVSSRLRDDPLSGFRQNLVCIALNKPGEVHTSMKILAGKMLREWPEAPRERMLASEDELHNVLQNLFGIHPPDMTGIWQKINDRHKVLFPA
jgi:N-hydroxyarylamine O-acetyltransferase